MQVRALTLFMELANARSIRQASHRLNLTPTAVIRQIDQLEHYFQTPLFDRTGGGIRLTDAGTLLAGKLPTIVAELSNCRALIDDLRRLDRGHISIHAGGAVIADLLAPVICTVQNDHPNLRFEITIASASSVTTAIAQGSADLGVLIFTPETGFPFIHRSHPISHAAFLSPEHPLAQEKHLSITQLARQRLALPDRAFGSRRHLDRAARKAGLTLDPVFTATSLEVQRELAIRNAAVLVLPEFCCRRERNAGLLNAIPLAPDCGTATTMDILLQPNRTHPFATRAFLKVLEHSLTCIKI